LVFSKFSAKIYEKINNMLKMKMKVLCLGEEKGWRKLVFGQMWNEFDKKCDPHRTPNLDTNLDANFTAGCGQSGRKLES
jgi:hypothetical protein